MTALVAPALETGEHEWVPRRRSTRAARQRARRRRARRRALVPVVALAVLAAVLLPGGSPSRQPVAVAVPAGATDPDAEDAAHDFLDRYVDPDGRVVRRDQGGDTVSEGQAYALLLAVAVNDRARFDLVWDWTRDELQRRDGLLSWHWRDGRVTDPEPAADADVDAAHALLIAADRFDEPRYAREALRIARAIRRLETAETPAGPVLVAGPWAAGRTLTVNPGYFDPLAFGRLGTLTGDAAWWGELTEGGYAVVDDLAEDHRFPPDWAVVIDGDAMPIPAPGSSGGSARYGLDAARLPVRFAAACDPRARHRAAALWPTLSDVAPSMHAQTSDLSGRPVTRVRHALAAVAAAASAAAAGDRDRVGPLLDAATALDRRTPSYYGAAWVALGRVLLETELLGGCPDAAPAPRLPDPATP